MKKYVLGFFALLMVAGSFVGAVPVLASPDEPSSNQDTQLVTDAVSSPVTLYFFEDKLCSVCAQQKVFLAELSEQYPDLTIVAYDISDTNRFRELAAENGIDDYRIMAPSTLVGGELLQFAGFSEREERALIAAIEGDAQADDGILKLPIIGREIDAGSWSAPLLAVILGTLDGFNVCSLGALILILTIVLTFDSRKKVFFFGGVFILTTIVVYGTLVFVWGQLINAFIGQLGALRLIVGLAALAGAAWFFKEFWRFWRYGPTCESSTSKLARFSSQRLLDVFKGSSKGVWTLAGAIVLFATAITIVELPCSIGVPIAFTAILVENGVSLGAYALYILIYLFFYMLIEIVVFTVAVLTKEIWFAGSKLITWTTLVGALVLLLLGLYYILSLL